MMKLYTTKEIADILQVSVFTVFRWIREGKLKHVMVGANYRVTQEQLDEFIKKGK